MCVRIFSITLYVPEDKLMGGGGWVRACVRVCAFYAFYSCGLSTATIEYSCPSASLRACLSVFPSVYTRTQKKKWFNPLET